MLLSRLPEQHVFVLFELQGNFDSYLDRRKAVLEVSLNQHISTCIYDSILFVVLVNAVDYYTRSMIL